MAWIIQEIIWFEENEVLLRDNIDVIICQWTWIFLFLFLIEMIIDLPLMFRMSAHEHDDIIFYVVIII